MNKLFFIISLLCTTVALTNCSLQEKIAEKAVAIAQIKQNIKNGTDVYTAEADCKVQCCGNGGCDNTGP